jgi:hypothetical protein
MRQNLGKHRQHRNTYRLRNTKENIRIYFEVVDFEKEPVVFLWYLKNDRTESIIHTKLGMFKTHEPYCLDYMRNLWYALKQEGYEQYEQ